MCAPKILTEVVEWNLTNVFYILRARNSDIKEFKVGDSSKINWNLDMEWKYEWTKTNTS